MRNVPSPLHPEAPTGIHHHVKTPGKTTVRFPVAVRAIAPAVIAEYVRSYRLYRVHGLIRKGFLYVEYVALMSFVRVYASPPAGASDSESRYWWIPTPARTLCLHDDVYR